MSTVQRLVAQSVARVRKHLRVVLAALFAIVFVGGYVALSERAATEANARKAPEQIAVEADPDAWLSNPTSASTFRASLDDGRVAAVAVADASPGLVLYTLVDGARRSTTVPGCSRLSCAGTLLDKLGDRSAAAGFSLVHVDVDPRPAARRLFEAVASVGSTLLLVVILGGGFFAIMKMQMRMGGGLAAKLARHPDAGFADVVGNEEAKRALLRVKAFMKDPSSYAKLGARAPRGVLLVGPPGTGKTLLAKALAGESRRQLHRRRRLVLHRDVLRRGRRQGQGELFALRAQARAVRAVHRRGRRHRQALDAATMRGAESESNRIINRVLVEMDGFAALDNVIVVAATNHENNIDEAMRRPGRFDMLVRLGMPTLPERAELFGLYLDQGRRTTAPADTLSLARMTQGLSPADIANIVNKAASTAAEAGDAKLTPDARAARDRDAPDGRRDLADQGPADRRHAPAPRVPRGRPRADRPLAGDRPRRARSRSSRAARRSASPTSRARPRTRSTGRASSRAASR